MFVGFQNQPHPFPPEGESDIVALVCVRVCAECVLGGGGGRRGSFHHLPHMPLFAVQAPVQPGPVVRHRLQVIFLVQKVQGVVAGQAPDGELVRDFGPVLPVAGHPLVQLGRLGEEVLEKPRRQEVRWRELRKVRGRKSTR